MEAFITANGIATRYCRTGRGERCVVLLHGYGESLDVWETFGGQLGKSFDVVTIDLPGSGISDWGNREVIDIDFMADVVADVLAKIGVERYSVVGHSMGGYVAVALAERHAKSVERLVLFHSSPAGDSPEKRDYRNREIKLVEEGKKELLASVNPGRGFAPQNVDKHDDTIEELAEQMMLTDDRAIVATLRGMAARADRSDFFAALSERIPVMMIFGAMDSYIPTESRLAMMERYPKAGTILLEKSGHMGFIEQPAESLAALTAFLGA